MPKKNRKVFVPKSGKTVRSAVSQKVNKGRKSVVTAGMPMSVSAPISMGYVKGSNNRQSFRNIEDRQLGAGMSICGTELFRFVRVYGTGASTGYALSVDNSTANSTAKASLAPANLTLTSQLYTFASLFGLYRYRSLKLRYVPTCPTSTSCLLTFSVQFDADVGEAGMGTLTSIMTSYAPYVVETPAWSAASITIPVCPRVQNAYYTDYVTGASWNELRMVNQATATGFADNNTEVTYGRLYLDYDVEFYQRGVSCSAPLSLLSFTTPAERKTLQRRQEVSNLKSVNTFDSTLVPTALMSVGTLESANISAATSVPCSIVGVVEVKGTDSLSAEPVHVAGGLAAGSLPVATYIRQTGKDDPDPAMIQGAFDTEYPSRQFAAVGVKASDFDTDTDVKVVTRENAWVNVDQIPSAQSAASEGAARPVSQLNSRPVPCAASSVRGQSDPRPASALRGAGTLPSNAFAGK